MMDNYTMRVFEMLTASGSFEILADNPETGRFTLVVDGKTYTADVDIDTLTRGAGMTDPSEVTEYMDVMNPEFLTACDQIAWVLGWIPPID